MLANEAHRSSSRSAGEGWATADMLAQYAYCPRRFHLVYAEGRWADNAMTDEGRWYHRRVDAENGGILNPADHPEMPRKARAVELGDEELHFFAKLDLAETSLDENGVPIAIPVETKRGEMPTGEAGEPERVQLMGQALLLRRHGYKCEMGIVYYATSRRRLDVRFSVELEDRTMAILAAVIRALACPGTPLPPPLVDSPKCPRCSLAGICLPDETVMLASERERSGSDSSDSDPHTRRLYPARDDALPLYVQEQGAYVGKKGESLYVQRKGECLAEVKLKDISQLVLCGGVSISPAALHLLCEADVAVVHLSHGHWFYGVTRGWGLRNAFDRAAQFRHSADSAWCLDLAKELVRAKTANQRTLLRRNAKPQPDSALSDMSRFIDRIDGADDLGTLLGIEGSVAAAYFGSFAAMLRPRGDGESGLSFDFSTRNRRPPRDPVNALLSFGYALLAKECAVALLSVGLDPHWGFFHQPRHGRPALALDLMEEFRPVVVDSTVISAINGGMVHADQFRITGAGCALDDSARKAFIRAYEGRLDQLVTHPVFDYRCSWRRLIALQAQVLSRVLRGDIPKYTGMTTR
ncbi:MAG: CRISPR-associated endonuclease Cas1 [Pseudomonadota bacterium]